MKRILTTMSILTTLVVASGCRAPSEVGARQYETITDASYLTAPLWNDGQAEVAFYRVRRTVGAISEDLLLGSYLVKHDFDPAAEAKATSDSPQRISAFKYALFFEYERGSYEFKESHVVNARQHDLRPLKASFTSFDWCSNLYREQAFDLDGGIEYLMRSDDYGNARATYELVGGAFPPALVPLVVRSLDLSPGTPKTFGVLLDSGEVVSAVAESGGSERIETETGDRDAERVVVTYDGTVPSPFAGEADEVETYWRGVGGQRLLLGLEGSSGAYRVVFVESLRSPYWEEDVYERLERVDARP